MTHTYSKKVQFNLYYTYDNKQKKIYDLKTMQYDFKEWIKKLNSQQKNK